MTADVKLNILLKQVKTERVYEQIRMHGRCLCHGSFLGKRMADSYTTYSCHSSGEKRPWEEPNRSAFCFWSGLIPDVGGKC